MELVLGRSIELEAYLYLLVSEPWAMNQESRHGAKISCLDSWLLIEFNPT